MWGVEEHSVQGRGRSGGTNFFIFTLLYIFTGRQGARRKERALALFSCIKKHQCPGLGPHYCKRCREAQGPIVTD